MDWKFIVSESDGVIFAEYTRLPELDLTRGANQILREGVQRIGPERERAHGFPLVISGNAAVVPANFFFRGTESTFDLFFNSESYLFGNEFSPSFRDERMLFHVSVSEDGFVSESRALPIVGPRIPSFRLIPDQAIPGGYIGWRFRYLEAPRGSLDFVSVLPESETVTIREELIGNAGARFSDVIALPDGGYLFVGYSGSDDYGRGFNPDYRGRIDGFVVRTSRDLQVEELFHVGSNWWDELKAVARAPNGKIYIIGETSPGAGVDSFSTFDGPRHQGNGDLLFAVLDRDYTPILVKRIGGAEFEDLSEFFVLDTSRILLAYTSDPEPPPGSQQRRSLLVELDTEGNEVRRWFDEGHDGRHLSQILRSRDGSVFLVGSASNGSDRDMYLGKFRQNGSAIWERTYGGTGVDSAWQLHEGADGTLYLLGGSSSPEWPTVDPGFFGRDRTTDLVVLKLDSLGVRVD